MDRSLCLQKANELIVKDRAETYGYAQESFDRLSQLWSAYLGIEISSKDAALMMGIYKISRCKSNQDHEDNYIDLCGYGALACEIKSRTTK